MDAHARILAAHEHGHPPDLGGVSIILGNVTNAIAYLARLVEWQTMYKHAPKVHAFADAILGDTEAVPVDSILTRALAGPNVRLHEARRQRMEQAIRLAAQARGVSPRTMQATVWVAYRGTPS